MHGPDARNESRCSGRGEPRTAALADDSCDETPPARVDSHPHPFGRTDRDGNAVCDENRRACGLVSSERRVTDRRSSPAARAPRIAPIPTITTSLRAPGESPTTVRSSGTSLGSRLAVLQDRALVTVRGACPKTDDRGAGKTNRA